MPPPERLWSILQHKRFKDSRHESTCPKIQMGVQYIPGFQRIQLLRRPCGDKVEFVTILWFDSLDAVREFAGEDYEVAVVPDKARAMLARFDERSQHYEVKAERSGLV